nr:reverse transcriptase domain-containing protein [Tanacetum cinerariifolium]
MNTASSSGMGSLPSNTVPNPCKDLKAITTRSGVTLARPSVSPSSSSKKVDREPDIITNQVLTGSTNNFPPPVVRSSPASTSFSTISSSKMPEVTKDTVQPSIENIQPPMTQIHILIYEPVVSPRSKPTIPYPTRVNKLKPKTPVNEKCFAVILKKLPEKLGDPDKFLIPFDFPEFNECLALADLACEEYVQEVLGFSDNSKSDNSTPISDPVIALSPPSLTPFEGGDFILEEIEACLTSESILPRTNDTDLDLEGYIRLLEEFLNNDPSLSPLPLKELNVEEIKTVKSSI